MDTRRSWKRIRGLVAISAMVLCTAARCDDASRDFSRMHGAERVARPSLLRQYPVGKQVDLYLAAMRRIHPPQPGLADVVAELGEFGVPLIEEKLRNSSSDFERVDLSLVLVRMEELGTYHVRDDESLREVHAGALSKTSDEYWRRVLQEHRSRIGW